MSQEDDSPFFSLQSEIRNRQSATHGNPQLALSGHFSPYPDISPTDLAAMPPRPSQKLLFSLETASPCLLPMLAGDVLSLLTRIA
jgi:hypothetical protein